MSFNRRGPVHTRGGAASPRSWSRTFTFCVGLAVSISGCRAFSAASADCAPPTDGATTSEAVAHPDVLAGTYRLTLVATSGPREGHRVDDLTLHLTLQRPELRVLSGPGGQTVAGVTQPLIGTLEGDVSEVGATVPGSLTSEDPNAPGVAVLAIEDQDTGAIRYSIRLGSESNRRDRLAFDAAFTVLRLSQVEEHAFRGEWSSGSGGATGQASGHFCADPSDEP